MYHLYLIGMAVLVGLKLAGLRITWMCVAGLGLLPIVCSEVGMLLVEASRYRLRRVQREAMKPTIPLSVNPILSYIR